MAKLGWPHVLRCTEVAGYGWRKERCAKIRGHGQWFGNRWHRFVRVQEDQ